MGQPKPKLTHYRKLNTRRGSWRAGSVEAFLGVGIALEGLEVASSTIGSASEPVVNDAIGIKDASGVAEDIGDASDSRVAVAARKKFTAGGALSQREQAALRRVDARSAEELRKSVLSAVPQSVLETLLNTSRKVIREWEEAGMPRNPGSGSVTYDLMVVLPWVKARWMARDGGGGTIWAEELRLKAARADLIEVHLAEKRGQLVSRDSVRLEGEKFVRRVKQALEVMPQRAAPELVGLETHEIHGVLTARVHEALTLASEAMPMVHEDVETAKDVDNRQGAKGAK